MIESIITDMFEKVEVAYRFSRTLTSFQAILDKKEHRALPK
jgi:hypothetical protein